MQFYVKKYEMKYISYCVLRHVQQPTLKETLELLKVSLIDN